MILFQKIKILSKLGEILRAVANQKEWAGFEMGVDKEEYTTLQDLVNSVHIYNGWFTPESVRNSFNSIGNWLQEEQLKDWINQYPVQEQTNKTVALIMAGNIPLVGFHDFLTVFLSGNKAKIKLSSDDQHLFPALINILRLFAPEIDQWVEIVHSKLTDFDAVIATGSNNSATYFQSYFGKYPHIIRKNRTAVAVISGEETKEELKTLGQDIFTYFGLGCRNVSQLLIPENFDLDRLFDAIFDFKDIINHNKYANNYDYNKAVYLMNLESILDNGFLLLKESEELNSPLGMLYFYRYSTFEEIEKFIAENKTEIQVVVGQNYVPFGNAQSPSLNDYADGIDTLKFLTEL